MNNKLKYLLILLIFIGFLLVIYGIYTTNKTNNYQKLDSINSVELSTLGTSNIKVDRSIRKLFMKDSLMYYLSNMSEFDSAKDLDSQYYDIISSILYIDYVYKNNINEISSDLDLPELENGVIDYVIDTQTLYNDINKLYDLNINDIDFMSINIYNYNNLVDFTYNDPIDKKLYFTTKFFDNDVADFCIGIRDIEYVEGRYKIIANVYTYYLTDTSKENNLNNQLIRNIESGNYDYIDKNFVDKDKVQKSEKVFYLTDNNDKIFKYKVYKVETLNSDLEKREIVDLESESEIDNTSNNDQSNIENENIESNAQ